MSLLQVRHLRKNFGGLRAVDDVSMEIPSNKMVLIIGPNGSGKTTFLNCISGLYNPDHGEIVYKGSTINGKAPHEIAKMGIVKSFQIPSPFPKLSVLENMAVSSNNVAGEDIFSFLLRKRWIAQEKERIRKAFDFLKLLDLYELRNMPAYTLSGGQLKLLEIGRLLMTKGETFLLDEPIGGVNPILAHKIFDYIVRHRNETGSSFIIIEHWLDIAMRYVDYVYAMSHGKVVAEGSREEIVNDKTVFESFLNV
jgi:branched-chain amino acid transport system ATP-binding protein